jgi:5-methylcytosine-specific restriction endonuclease McrA
VPVTQCEKCGAERTAVAFVAKDGRVLCRDCRGVGRPRTGGSARPRSTCPQCGVAFEQRYGRKLMVTCSKRCANLRRHGVPPGGHPTGHNARRFALEQSRPGLIRSERAALMRRWVAENRSCVYCGDAARSIDHVVPLHVGGTNFLYNLVPACVPCNTSKGRKTLAEWGGRRGHPLRDVWYTVYGEAGFCEVLRGALQEARSAGPWPSRYRDIGDSAQVGRSRGRGPVEADDRPGSGVDGARTYERGPDGHGPWCCGFGSRLEA